MCRTFSGRVYSIVAADAIAHDVEVIEIGGQPGCRRVAVLAVVATRYVCCILAGCRNAIVAGAAGSHYLAVIDHQYGLPERRIVAILTYFGRENMCWIFPGRVDPIVAVAAVADDCRVIEISRQPGDGRVAVVAVIAAIDVRRGFSGCCNAVVTGAATAENLRMVHHYRRLPDGRTVTVLAYVRRLEVSWALAGCVRTVVTT